ncbi:hypothetical protein [Rhizobium wuzhouense]|uniref:Uncharacterized protein n=1 Tax=Rhizobium wuzhouense TaxID=1986026 RepID=A0ABX5NQT1_9HYPH|nr:hypothetical protein [Rhizobium wuzhouense]PYB73215.1 hypothetical protein DMY87_12945 [Rhizobium wuzhouense]
MQQVSKYMVLATDVAHIVLFHPDDLGHAEHWPIAWYAETFIYPVESAAGRLIAWCTGSDGVFKLRLTTGDLSERERAFSGPSFVFPYRVRHGRVFVDNSDGLPGVEKMTDPSASPELWFDLADGDYAVTVTAVEWEAEPSARDEGHETLPNYVVAFAPLDGRSIKPARRPPDLIGSRDALARDEPFGSRPYPPDPVDFTRLYPAFAAADVAPVGRAFESRGEAPVEAAVPPGGDDFAVFDIRFVIAADLVPGAPAVLASCHGVRGRPQDEKVFSFKSEHVVAIVSVEGFCRNGDFSKPERHWIFGRRREPLPTDALATVKIAPRAFAEDGPARVDLVALKAQILADLEGGGVLGTRLGGVAGYEALRLAATEEADLLADWLLDHLPLSGRDRLAISLLPINDRFAALEQSYRAFRDDV